MIFHGTDLAIHAAIAAAVKATAVATAGSGAAAAAAASLPGCHLFLRQVHPPTLSCSDEVLYCALLGAEKNNLTRAGDPAGGVSLSRRSLSQCDLVRAGCRLRVAHKGPCKSK